MRFMDKHSVTPLAELLDAVRNLDGFPLGKDEDILALSDPPFYTACPNPYIAQFIAEYGKPYDPEQDDYQRTPFVGDVSEGKNDPIYNAHSYHTKVPHKAIMQFIKHYTEEGDLVFDGFCGTGMTGVAAQLLNRKAILSDLSPAATFIAYNYNTPLDAQVPGTEEMPGTSEVPGILQLEVPGTNVPGTWKVPGKASGIQAFEREANRILKEVEQECGWMYETLHTDGKTKGIINFTVWSDVFICPYCRNEYVFWEVAVDQEKGKVQDEYACPQCNATIDKRESERAKISFFDSATRQQVTQTKQVPVLINYTVGKKRFEKTPDEFDRILINKIETSEIPYWFPIDRMPEGDESRRNDKYGITHVHHFYTKRNLNVLSEIWGSIRKSQYRRCEFWFTSTLQWCSRQSNLNIKNYLTGGGGVISPGLRGTWYIASLVVESNVIQRFKLRLKSSQYEGQFKYGNFFISTQSSVKLTVYPANSVDYIFIDPPFGDNLMYSELNLMWESWLKVFTNNQTEAIINRTQNKHLSDYQQLMLDAFKEYYRVLKPNRWMTVVFHNSKASVWNVIQEAITRAGFIIAQVAVLDKQKGSFKQVTTAGAVKNDLVINAYKPKQDFAERFLRRAGEGMEVDFVSQLLEHLPVEPHIGRTEQMLYSKMLAHYVENGFKIRYNANTFYKLLAQQFTELDGYWFLDSQTPAYNEWKSRAGLEQLQTLRAGQRILFVADEKSALTWLYHFLETPQDYSAIYTAYQQVATKTEDVIPEVRELLEHNFICDQEKYRRPLNIAEREVISQNRERELALAFQKLLEQARTQKGVIRTVRREALVFGLTQCYQDGRYHDILTVANKLPASLIEASGELMDFVDIARIKTAGDEEAKLL